MGDSGITISTAQSIGAAVFLVTTIGTLLGIIRRQYADTIAKLEARIFRLEEAEERRVDLLERAVDALSRTTGVTEEVVRQAPRRSGRTGDD